MIVRVGRLVRRLGLAAGVGVGIYVGPFLPSPLVWGKGVYHMLKREIEAKNLTDRLYLTNVVSDFNNDEDDDNCSKFPHKISIVISVFNEGGTRLQKFLEDLHERLVAKSASQHHHHPLVEVILVNPGCSDDSFSKIPMFADMPIRVVPSKPGRGAALRKGARVATGDILLFLHADTVLPVGFDSMICASLADPDVLLSAFELKIDIDPSSQNSEDALNRIANATNLRSRMLWLPYGDQAIAMRKATYERLGGIKEMKMMEDFDLVTRTRNRCIVEGKRINIIPAPALSSGRRWEENGVFTTTMKNWFFVTAYVWFNVSPEKIFEWYYRK